MAYNDYYGGGGHAGYGGGYGAGGGYGQGGGFGAGSGGYGGGYETGYPGYGTEEHYHGGRGNAGIPFVAGPSPITPAGNHESFYNTSRGGGDKHKHPKDLPVHSRLFVVHGKDTEESDLRESFSNYGEVEDVNMLKKKCPDTRELICTGVSFVKFKKASQAAKAIEELHGKALGCSPKPLKILVALSENQPGEVPDDERLRLYIKVPEGRDEEEVKAHFKSFGTVEYFNIPKDRVTGKGKGFGYVKYFRFLDAALALEDCDPYYKAIFAQARPSGAPTRSESSSSRGPSYSNSGPPAMMGAEYLPPPKQAIQNILMPLPDAYSNPIIKPESSTCLRILVDKAVDERQLTLLCDIIPGFKRCDMKASGTFEATFTTKGWAQYASDKLGGFEYPPGSRLIVKFIPDPNGGSSAGPAAGEPDVNAPFYPVDVPLPPIKPTVSKLENAAGYAKRLFIVCHPCALAPHVLQNAFCRFGELIDVYTLPGKNFGYAKYATTEAAEECKKTLHRASIAGCSLKVIDAEDDRDGGSDAKRRRT